MNIPELYKKLIALTGNKEEWEANIPYVSSLLSVDSVKIQAKALWLLGEMGLRYPHSVAQSVPVIFSFCESGEPLLRERAVTALGRIGRGCFPLIEPYWENLFQFAKDKAANVRLAFIWASENIAVNTPDVYAQYLPVFSELLRDSNEKVRMEAPEMFRVLGKRRPAFIEPYIGVLRQISETDSNRVVRAHCVGAINAANRETENDSK